MGGAEEKEKEGEDRGEVCNERGSDLVKKGLQSSCNSSMEFLASKGCGERDQACAFCSPPKTENPHEGCCWKPKTEQEETEDDVVDGAGLVVVVMVEQPLTTAWRSQSSSSITVETNSAMSELSFLLLREKDKRRR